MDRSQNDPKNLESGLSNILDIFETLTLIVTYINPWERQELFLTLEEKCS